MCGCLGICTCPAHSAVSASQALAARRAAIPVGSDISGTLVRQLSPPPEQRPDRHRATSSPRRSGALIGSGAPDAVGARNGSQRIQPPSDVARPDQILLAGQWLPIRLSPTMTDARIRSGRPAGVHWDTVCITEGEGLYACHRAGYSLVYGPAGPARRERRSDTPARGTPSQACPGTTTDRKLVPPQVHRSVLPKPGTPCRPTHPAGMRALPGGPADRQQGSGDLAMQRSGNDEAGRGLSPVGDGGRGLGP